MKIYKIALRMTLALSVGRIWGSSLVGELPERAAWLAQSILDSNQMLRAGKEFKSTRMLGRLILHGPPGNGKSTMAVKIAELGNAKLFKIHGPSIVGRYLGQGADTIEKVFKEACCHANEHRQTTVIVIDEIDAIAGNNTTEFRSEHSAALQKLWLLLDDYKHDPRIYVICTTNNLEQLHKAFIDRFGSNCIEVGYPNEAKRQQILEYYFKEYGNTCINADLLQTLVEKTDAMSIRCLEDLARDASFAAYVSNSGQITSAIVMKTLDDIVAKWKAHDKGKSWVSLETWRSVIGVSNELTHTLRNVCFLYAAYKVGLPSLSHF